MRTAAIGFCVAGLLASSALAEPQELNQVEAEQLIRGRLESYMKDPGSAQLKIDRGPLYGTVKTDDATFTGWLVCGQLNGRNSYGGYVGYEPYLFVIEPETKAVRVLPRITRFLENVNAWRSACYLDPPDVGGATPPAEDAGPKVSL